MAEAKRMSPGEVHDKMERGDVLLVCAYDDESKCREVLIEGAIPLTELDEVPEEQQLVFYCA